MSGAIEWLYDFAENRRLEVVERPGDNKFIATSVKLLPTKDDDVTLDVGVNDKNQISIIDSDPIHFSELNIAEGFTENEMRKALTDIFEKKYTVDRGWFGKRIAKLKIGKTFVYGKIKAKAQD